MDVDDHLADARRALQEAPLHGLRNLQVERSGEVLVISGKVDSFYHKQMAQETIRAVCSHIRVKNVVDVS